MKVKFKSGLKDFEGYDKLKGNVYEARQEEGGDRLIVTTPIGTYTVVKGKVELVEAGKAAAQESANPPPAENEPAAA